MSAGFVLRKLSLKGPGVEDARLEFARGLNVIAGPSDTGKTFIVECIDFAMGSGSEPRDIARARSYTSIFLDIEGPDGTTYAFERGLRGGDIRLSVGPDTRTIAAKHDSGGGETVSHILLSLCGLEDKRIRTNAQGKTRALSFRDISPLVIVDEESVITKRSPVLSGQYTEKTAESSVFRMLLTGTDDSGVIARDDPKVLKGRQEGRAEVLAVLLEKTREQLQVREISSTIEDKRDQLRRAESAFEAAGEELAGEQGSVTTLEERRRSAWNALRQIESRTNVLTELQKRFELLQDQYTSDLRRLEAVAEAGVRLGQMKEDRCPVCGALPEHHQHEHQQHEAAPAEVARASRAEAAKTLILLQDLKTTLASNAGEIQHLALQRDIWQKELDQAAGELKTQFQPRLQIAVQKLRELQARRDAVREELELLARADEYETLLADANAPRGKQKRAESVPAVSSGHAEDFSKEAEALLKSWHFPNLDRVTFSEEDLDIVISGEPRRSHGKGVRAITHAAFNLALLRLCDRRQKPFPSFVLIDSPLVVYREPDPGEEQFPVSVKEAFYRSIAEEFKGAQVIVLENDEPPVDLASKANVVLFTGSKAGRWGFIPQPNGSTTKATPNE
jgi:hypothetical protein